jgi:hypothetical protein
MVPGRMPRRSLLNLAGGAALGALAPERLATAAQLSADEIEHLRTLAEVRVPLDLDLPQGFYFGGIVYRLCLASVDSVMARAADPADYPGILAWTREARVLTQSGRDMQVYLRHDVGSISASYVLLVRRESQGLIRFWVDPSQPHDLDDGWGFLRVEPRPRELFLGSLAKSITHISLLTWGVLLRIDSDELRLRFSEQIRRGAMETPARIVTGSGPFFGTQF